MNINDLINESKVFLEKKDFSLEEAKKLDNILKIHSDLYYNKENPVISDKDYDDLFLKMKKLKDKFNYNFDILKEVWSDIIESSFEKVAHTRPMISLDNTYNDIDLIDFNWRVIKNINNENIDFEYTIEYKFDWLWLELIYESGFLIQAITRWNWIVWEDVTQNAMQIQNIPKKIDFKDRLEIRWEVVMPLSVFNELNEYNLKNNLKVFSNPRNAASWSLRLLDNSITKERKLEFYVYDLWDFSLFKENNYFNLINKLKSFWFSISSYFKVCKNIFEVIKEISDIDNNLLSKKDFLKNHQIDYDIDWLVIKVNNIDLWQQIGLTEHHPKYAIAYKFKEEISSTRVFSIEHSVWRTWTITPVANLEAVKIWWVIVKRATLHNYDELRNLWLMIWDMVFIKRAWEVIPDIISVIKEHRNWTEENISIPEFCPECNTKIKKDDEKVRYYCPNHLDCPAQISWKIIYQVWKNWLNIDGLWEKQVELFIEMWFIKDLVDIFSLYKYKDDILQIEWYKDKSVNNLLNAINNSKTIKIDTFLASLAISWVGKKIAKLLANIFSNKEDILNFSFLKEQIMEIDGIWEEIAKNIISYFEDNKTFLDRYLDEVEIVFDKKNDKTWVFVGQKVCITWSFLDYSRDDLVKILEENWWEFMSSVSKKTSFLLAWSDAWSKLEKAQNLWVKIMSIDEFFSLLKNR